MRGVQRAICFALVTFLCGLGMSAAQETSGPLAAKVDSSPFLRVFLKDGSSLVSYGELARLDDRVVFSMPTSVSDDPALHLVTLASDRVDWDRTTRYADSARASRYISTRAEQDYAALTDEVAQALEDISRVDDARLRLAIVERARKTLAEWPGRHYNYKHDEIRQLVGTLDEAIADLRAAAGLSRFDLSFVASVEAPVVTEPLLPLPTPREAIEQTLLAARLTESSVERVSLMTVALGHLERDSSFSASGTNSAEWVPTTISTVKALIATELAVDQLYQSLTRRILAGARRRAKVADVRGVRSLLTQIPTEDKRLGAHRPEAVAALVAAVQDQLDSAQRLRLARDQWLLKSGDYRKYEAAVEPQLARLRALKPALEDIKALAGSTPATLTQIQSSAAQILKAVSLILAPEDLRPAHALLVSAAQLADNAARIRREAALAGDITRAWDASSAAAGALMLTDRASAEIQAMLKPPVPIR